jgi:hypothetical protein
VVLLVSVTILAATSTSVRRQLKLSFTQVPISYANLSFQRPGALPEAAVPGQHLQIPIVITNMGPDVHSYHFLATVAIGSKTAHIIESGRATVPGGGHSVMIQVAFTVPFGARSFIFALPGEPNVVHFPFAKASSSG